MDYLYSYHHLYSAAQTLNMIGAMAVEDLTMNKAAVANRSRNQSLNPNLARPSTMGTDRASNAAALRSSFPTGGFGAQIGETYPNIGIYKAIFL